MRASTFTSIFTTILSLVSILDGAAQNPARGLLEKADSARMAYEFPLAVELCGKAVELDSTVRERAEELILSCQNGVSMMGFCSQPTVVARREFSLKNFFLYYPLENGSWHLTPNQLDTLGGDRFSKATYIPDEAKDIFYTAKDAQGIRNIYTTSLVDSLWSAPRLVNENLTSSSDEIYPMLSQDGKSLYFASKGLFGMGGYDLYVSKWNDGAGDWDAPVNLGFPYSSPYDDLLFINTEDGKYSIFASNRGCGKDSVCIYVLEYDAMPVRKAVTDTEELRRLSNLAPSDDPSRMDNGAAVPDDKMRDSDAQRYLDKMNEVRAMRDSVESFNKILDNLRNGYSSVSAENRAKLAEIITERELMLPALRDSLARATKALQEIELEFLMKGVVIDADKLRAEADKEVVGASSGYTFSKNNLGTPISLSFKERKPSLDFSFKILPEGRIVPSDSLPGGLVYQVQLFTQSRKAIVGDVRGLSPVFEKLNSSKKYTYSAGVFRTYKDVLSQLNTVKSRGFHDAFIVAWMDGRTVSVNKARSMESEVVARYVVKIHPDGGSSLGDEALAVLRRDPGKDIIKSEEDGSVVYSVGPFNDRESAQRVVSELKEKGIANISIESLD